MKIGARFVKPGKCEFTVWGPFLKQAELKVVSPREMKFPMERDAKGYWHASVRNIQDIQDNIRYVYRLENNRDRPDPASHFQPLGVHGPSQAVIHSAFGWEDQGWKGIKLSHMIMYELHVGTFTPEGTFDAVVNRLSALKDLGINAIEIMPVSQFPGERNWGYDGVFPFAVQNSYGRPDSLKRLVNECHKQKIAVILDVVYNHLGPEGNYLWDYGPYFTDKYRTPWGMALNFDDAYSNEVRNYFIENALHWFRHYHIDALRIDAIHGISDLSAKPFLQELSEAADNFSSHQKKPVYLIAESDLNDARIIRSRDAGGIGIHAQWSDDFHHSLHTLLTGETDGYYADFGKTEHLNKAIKEGFVYSGIYSQYRKRNHGNSSRDISGNHFVIASQNHDQIGNRAFGERLANLVSFESLKLAAGTLLLSPYIPLLFMGEEYGETTPFLYFVSHSDPDLIEAVRKGRKEEFKSFAWKGKSPDPQDMDTFLKSKIHWEKREEGINRVLLNFYRILIHLRKRIPSLSNFEKNAFDITEQAEKIFLLDRWKGKDRILSLFNFDTADRSLSFRFPRGTWNTLIDSSDRKWKGERKSLPLHVNGQKKLPLKGRSFILFRKKVA